MSFERVDEHGVTPAIVLQDRSEHTQREPEQLLLIAPLIENPVQAKRVQGLASVLLPEASGHLQGPPRFGVPPAELSKTLAPAPIPTETATAATPRDS